MLRIFLLEFDWVRQFKISEFKAWGNGTADKGKGCCVWDVGTKPVSGGHVGLEDGSRGGVVPQAANLIGAIWGNAMDDQGATCMEVPQLVRLDPMEGRGLMRFQKEVNAGAKTAIAVEATG